MLGTFRNSCWGVSCHDTFVRNLLQADGWEDIVFGNVDKQLLGRVAQAALLFHEEDPVCVVFGTGGSRDAEGTPEGEFTLNFLWRMFGRLSLFRAFDGVDLNM